MQLCTRDNITDLLLAAYVDKCEEMNPGIVDRTITAVSGEVTDLLTVRYPAPWPCVPELIRYIVSVIAAYRIVEAITSLVDTEAASANQWLPLQKQWKYCTDLLDDVQKGRTKLDFGVSDADRDDPAFAVIAPAKTFDWRGY